MGTTNALSILAMIDSHLLTEAKTMRKRVLLVDDHTQVRQAIYAVLTTHDDIQIIGQATDGNQAVEMASACQPDVVLLDTRMPKLNGIEAASVIKKERKETVIIGLCINRDAYTVAAFLKAGATAVVSKDRIDDLYLTIKQACA